MKREPFDAGKPAERLADRVRVEVVNLALRIMDDPDYRALSSIEQLEAFMAGGVTGVICGCFASIQPHGRDEMMQVIEAYLPQAREQAEAIHDGAMRRAG